MIHAGGRREDDAVRFTVPSRSSSPALMVTSSTVLFGSFAFVQVSPSIFSLAASTRVCRDRAPQRVIRHQRRRVQPQVGDRARQPTLREPLLDRAPLVRVPVEGHHRVRHDPLRDWTQKRLFDSRGVPLFPQSPSPRRPPLRTRPPAHPAAAGSRRGDRSAPRWAARPPR